MPRFKIERYGKVVKKIVFVGNRETDLYREQTVEVLSFDNEKQANELLTIWKDAKLIVEDETLQIAA